MRFGSIKTKNAAPSAPNQIFAFVQTKLSVPTASDFQIRIWVLCLRVIRYRSVIFFHTPEQEKTAIEMKTKLNPIAKEKFNAEIVTEIKPAQEFYVAEEYHQQYFAKSNL